MFRLNEVVRGRLIGPKTWDRIDKTFERKMEQPVTAPRLFGLIWVCLHMLIMYWLEKGREWSCDAGSQSEPLICYFSKIVTEGFTIPKTVLPKCIFVKLCVWLSNSNRIVCCLNISPSELILVFEMVII